MTIMSAASTQTPKGRDGRPIPPHIIAAARESFLRFGVHRATVADVARAAGMPRQALYEYVSSRNDLVDAALVQRIMEIADDIRPLATKGRDFARAFTDVSVAAIQRARSDEELMNMFTTGPSQLIHEVVAGPYKEIHEIVQQLLEPILQRGEKTGQLRTDQSRDQIIDWIRIVYLSLITQVDLDEEQLRHLVSGFLVPSLMFSKDERRQ